MNYKKELSALEAAEKREYQNYRETILKLKNEAQVYANSYNPKIGEINSERIQLRKEIKALYESLKFFGDLGEKITPFDYATEDYIAPQIQWVEEQHSQLDVKRESNNGFAIAVSALFVPLPLLPLLPLPFAFIRRKKSKARYMDGVMTLSHKRLEWEKQIADCEAEVAFLRTAAEIAEIYRNIIVIVKDAIDERIIPELSGISSFLYADAIKNCIIEGANPADARPQSIAIFRGTVYDQHYLFVQNAFDYYTLISVFFKESVLTKMMNDHEITAEERAEFEKNISDIKSKEEVLKGHAAFGGE